MRTEQEVLKDFEDLGWKPRDNYTNFTLYKGEINQHKFGYIIHHCYISIDKEKQTYVAIDIRDNEICWNGTKKDCKWWLSMTDPDNRPYYKIRKEELKNA